MIKVIPTWVWLLAIIVTGLVCGIGAYFHGKSVVETRWDEAISRGKATIDILKARAEAVTTVTEIKYRDVIKEVYVKGDTREKVRTIFVPTDSGNLSGGFRLLHDAAASNTLPDPARIPDASPIAVTDVAATVNANYTRCHEAYERVEAWTGWWASQKQEHDRTIHEYEKGL